MKQIARLALTATSVLAVLSTASAQIPSERARRVAEHAVTGYFDDAVSTLADLVAFRTVQDPRIPNAEHPDFRAMTDYLRGKAERLGLDFADHGAVVVIGLGDSADRLGLVTHGDVQPADPGKWARDPFSLDVESEPGLLVARGAEDDKGPIATALYAMRALADAGIAPRRRVELIISYTEESDWTPFQEFLERWDAPGLNVALDSEYPVVIAEKGWNAVFLALPADTGEVRAGRSGPRLASITGGAFLSQIPEDAEAVIVGPGPDIERVLRDAAVGDTTVHFSFHSAGDTLIVRARGRAAHSSKPWDGRNAITHLAALFGRHDWPDGQAARMVRLINDLVGTGDYAERFGDLAYSHEFMGPLTLSLTTLGYEDGDLVAGVNFRRPIGRSGEQVEAAVREAVADWQRRTGIEELAVRTIITDPYYLEDAPHVPVLLDIFRRYAGVEEAKPISIGGGTHARLVPNGVNFGPAMPGTEYTGHTEHEYMTREDFRLNLEMYTAMLVELAG